jgi:hypothetical protein
MVSTAVLSWSSHELPGLLLSYLQAGYTCTGYTCSANTAPRSCPHYKPQAANTSRSLSLRGFSVSPLVPETHKQIAAPYNGQPARGADSAVGTADREQH